MSSGYLRIMTGLYCLLVLEQHCAFRMCRVIYRILGLHACVYDIIMYMPMTSFIDTIVNNLMWGKAFCLLQQIEIIPK